ncbi:hypothetical protein ACFRAU_07340 [Arthrobacter sp. NPDC056691]|uniref:hypothetical protein n=1 Tax=Arthrobacter sp. NPDC056691 TaxID=3345913 RepID=UPI00366C39B2
MKLAHAITGLAQAVLDLAQQQTRTGTAMSDVAREQRITNLIVRAQISTDPQEKARLMGEATRRMDQPCRRSPHDPL